MDRCAAPNRTGSRSARGSTPGALPAVGRRAARLCARRRDHRPTPRAPSARPAGRPCWHRGLQVHFPIRAAVQAHRRPGQGRRRRRSDPARRPTLALVGESGCGKTTVGKGILQLERPTGGTVHYDGVDLAHIAPGAAPLSQGPADHLPGPVRVHEPAHAGGDIVGEGLQALGIEPDVAPRAAAASPNCWSRSASASRPWAAIPRVLRRPAPAHLHRPRAGRGAEGHRLRRAHQRPGRLGAGADPEPAQAAAAGPRAQLPVHHPRHLGGVLPGPRGGGHVPGRIVEQGSAEQVLDDPRIPTPRRCCPRCPSPTRPSAARSSARRRHAVTGQPALRLPLPPALPGGPRGQPSRNSRQSGHRS
jgi:energy-coupling factor transporter ATP-binding protein EcfA2